MSIAMRFFTRIFGKLIVGDSELIEGFLRGVEITIINTIVKQRFILSLGANSEEKISEKGEWIWSQCTRCANLLKEGAVHPEFSRGYLFAIIAHPPEGP